MRGEATRHLFQRRPGSRLFLDRGNPLVDKAARIDVREIAQIGRHVQREPVHRHIARSLDPDSADLARARRVALDPDAGRPVEPPGLDTVLGHGPYHALLDSPDILLEAQSETLEVQNRIADQLTVSVIGDVPAPVGMEVARPDRTQEFVAYEHIGLVTALAERVDMRMFHHQQRLPGPDTCLFRLEQLVEQALLHLPHGSVLRSPDIPVSNAFHDPFILGYDSFSWPSRPYRTSGP